MKKVVVYVISLFMLFSLTAVVFADEGISQKTVSPKRILTKDQINAKFDELSKKYKVNEKFSPEDADFVKRYAMRTQQSGGIGTNALSWGTGNHFIGWGLGSYSSIKTEGYLKVTLGIINNKVEVNMNTSDTNKTYHNKISNSLSFQGYGLIGSDGVGLVADFTLSSSSDNANWDKMIDEKSFIASVAYWHASPLGNVQDTSNSQSISVTFD